MAEVKLKEETELWDPAEHNNSVEPPRIKEEPEEVQLQEFPFFTPVSVKTEDDEDKSSVLHQRATEENREETNGEDCGAEAGCSSEEEHPKGVDSGEDSDWSWDWEPPPKQTVTGRRAAATKEPQTGVQIVSARREQFPFAPVSVKTEDDEDKSSVLRQRATEENREETNGEDCGAEAGCSSDPLTQLHSDSEEHPNGEDSDAEEEEDDEERPHKCSFCGKCFKNTSHFNQHLKIHSGEKPYSCSICKKAFLRSRTLTEHIRTHTGEKPFSCSVCKNDFTSKARMKKHMKIHTGEKPFSCPFCDKCFVQRSFLVIHIRQHTGEKPFSCTLCHRSYTDKSSLRKHMKKHRTAPVPQEPHSPLQNGLPESYDRERGSGFGHTMPSV